MSLFHAPTVNSVSFGAMNVSVQIKTSLLHSDLLLIKT